MKYVVSGAVVVLSLLGFGECVARRELLSVDEFLPTLLRQPVVSVSLK